MLTKKGETRAGRRQNMSVKAAELKNAEKVGGDFSN